MIPFASKHLDSTISGHFKNVYGIIQWCFISLIFFILNQLNESVLFLSSQTYIKMHCQSGDSGIGTMNPVSRKPSTGNNFVCIYVSTKPLLQLARFYFSISTYWKMTVGELYLRKLLNK